MHILFVFVLQAVIVLIVLYNVITRLYLMEEIAGAKIECEIWLCFD